MTFHVTYFHASVQTDGSVSQRNAGGLFGGQTGPAEALEPGQNGSVADRPRIALIKATDDGRCDIVRAGKQAGASAGMWFAGEVDTRWVAAGHRVSIGAAA